MKTTSATLLGMMLLSPLVAALPQEKIDWRTPSAEMATAMFKMINGFCGLNRTAECMALAPKPGLPFPRTIEFCRTRLCETYAASRKDLSSEECLFAVAKLESVWEDDDGEYDDLSFTVSKEYDASSFMVIEEVCSWDRPEETRDVFPREIGRLPNEKTCLVDWPELGLCPKALCQWLANGRYSMSSEECLAGVASVSDWKDRIGRRSADMSFYYRGGPLIDKNEDMSTIGPRSADVPSDTISQYEAAKERFREQMDNMNKQSPYSSYASPPVGIYAPPPDGIYPPPVGGWGSIDWNSIDYPSIAGRTEETEDS